MPSIVGILQHTPWWVFALLALLAALGIRSLRTRTTAVWRLLIVPAIFIGWGILSIAEKAAVSPALSIDWLAAGVIGVAIGWAATRLDGVQVDRAAGRVGMPGSAVPLLRNLAIFLAKYCLAVAMAIAPARQPALAHWDVAVSGIGAGYFVGWLIRFARKYRAAPPHELAAPVGSVSP